MNNKMEQELRAKAIQIIGLVQATRGTTDDLIKAVMEMIQ